MSDLKIYIVSILGTMKTTGEVIPASAFLVARTDEQATSEVVDKLANDIKDLVISRVHAQVVHPAQLLHLLSLVHTDLNVFEIDPSKMGL